MKKFKKNILITGSSSGIGWKIAQILYKNKNNNIIINSRNLKKLKKSSEELGNCKFVVGDVTKIKDLKKIGNKIKNIDVLICNVGNGKSAKPGEEKKEDWVKSLNENFFSAVDTIKIFEKKLIKSKGMIICISSVCGIEYVKDAPVTYSVSKSALNTFVKCYSKILGPKGVKLNAIAPGNIMFEGSVWQKKLKTNQVKVKNFLKNEVSLQKIGSSSDIAETVNFIISNSNFITGSVFVIDGGQTKNF